jgi:hypothetical protein
LFAGRIPHSYAVENPFRFDRAGICSSMMEA